MSTKSQNKFTVLGKVVKFLKQRRQDAIYVPLTFDEIIDQTNQPDIDPRVRDWLLSEALINNPKIQVTPDDKFTFKPTYEIRTANGLLNLLKDFDERALGGVLYDDVKESLPEADRAIKLLGDKVSIITRSDKKKVLFFNDVSFQPVIDDDFKKMWRSVAVGGIQEESIAEYLQDEGITTMKENGQKKRKRDEPKRKVVKRKAKRFKHEYLDDMLEDYSSKQL